MADERRGRNAGVYGRRDMSMRRITGLTRRSEISWHGCRVTGHHKKIMGRVSSHGGQSRHTEKI